MAAQDLMIKGYVQQTAQYFSESKSAFIQVKDMHPTYAANAAARMLGDAETWAGSTGGWTNRPQAWMIRQPLFLALVQRANQV